MWNIVITVLRTIFSLFDRLIIVFVNLSYSLLVKLSSLNLADTETIKAFNLRIGLILGIFMLFNIATQLLNYIISPDKISDKSKGGTKIITNIIVSLLVLAFVNIIFTTAYKVQNKIIEKQIIPQLIFGVKQDNNVVNNQGQEISFYVFSTMITINEEFTPQCKNIYLSGIDTNCQNLLVDALGQENFNSFSEAVKNKDASKLLNIENINATSSGKFVFDYTFLFSTVVGIIVLLILLGFCLDIATRCVKLYFFQLIAPIPIIANMVPGKGEETFKKWVKACISTYIDVFIRLIAVFFATYMIVITWNSLTDFISSHKLIGIFVILGALMFAKQLPQIIQDITGIKTDDFSINPLKKLEQSPFAAAALGYVGGRVGGAVANIWGARVHNDNIRKQMAGEGLTKGTAAYNKRFKELKGNTLLGYVGSAVAGSHSAGVRSFWAGMTGGGKKSLWQVGNAGITGASKARNQRDAGYNMWSKVVDNATDIAQIKNEYGTTDKLKGEIKKYQQDLENAKQRETVLSQELSRQMGTKGAAMAALSKVFDNAAERDDNGKFIAYKIKSYSDFTREQAKITYVAEQRNSDVNWDSYDDKQRIEKMKEYEENWDTLSDTDKNARMGAATAVLSSTDFDAINDLYISRNNVDAEARNLEKQIKSIQENMRNKEGKK